MSNIVHILRVHYTMHVNEEVIKKCLACKYVLKDALKGKIKGIHSIDYTWEKPRWSIDIAFNTNDIKEFDPKYNIKIWQKIAKIIDKHIKEKKWPGI